MSGQAPAPVPLVDVAGQYADIRAEVDAAVAAVFERGDVILGAAVRDFEAGFARWVGAEHGIGVGSGTDAVEIALRAAGLRPGDGVLVPANTFVASAIGILRAGGRPVYADIDERNHLMDLEAASDLAAGPGVRFLLAVHLYGRLIDPDALRAFCAAHDLVLVEDAAQAHGARSDAGSAGALGRAAAWSFYPAKNLGAYGDGGAVTTSDDAVAEAARAFRNYGSPRRYEHPGFGVNSRLDTVQAAVLGVKLARMDAWNDARRAAAAAYHERLADLEAVTLPALTPGASHVWHLFVVRVPDRDAVLASLQADGVGAGIHYPTPVPFLGAVDAPGRPGDYPVSERVSREIVSLPLFPELSDPQIDRVCAALRRAVA